MLVNTEPVCYKLAYCCFFTEASLTLSFILLIYENFDWHINMFTLAPGVGWGGLEFVSLNLSTCSVPHWLGSTLVKGRWELSGYQECSFLRTPHGPEKSLIVLWSGPLAPFTSFFGVCPPAPHLITTVVTFPTIALISLVLSLLLICHFHASALFQSPPTAALHHCLSAVQVMSSSR